MRPIMEEPRRTQISKEQRLLKTGETRSSARCRTRSRWKPRRRARPPRPPAPIGPPWRANQIPPPGAGAYGIVVFQSKATPANRDKLVMVCHSFVAFFPRGKDSNVPVVDQMITIWPIDDPTSSRVIADDCDYVIDHYDLTAAESAVRDAHRQQPQATFEGDGPYLIGWSPSNTRGVPDKLVLVIDMSADNSQASIDHKFLFWKDQIVEDPQKWRSGFSLDRVRTAIHDFADQYGQAMLDAIKLVDGK